MADLLLGRESINRRGFRCCGKPVGCSMSHEGCAYLSHPWKKANVFEDPQAPCSKEWMVDDLPRTCSLLHNHDGDCVGERR